MHKPWHRDICLFCTESDFFSNSITLIIWHSAEADPTEQGSANIVKEGDKFYLRGPEMDDEELGRFSANYLSLLNWWTEL